MTLILESFYIMTFLIRLNVNVSKESGKVNLKDHRTVTYQSKNTGTEEEEAPKSVLYSVRLLTSVDWMTVLSKKFQGLLSRNWQFQEKLKPATLERLKDELPQYVGADRPQRRKTKKRKARAE